MTDKLMLDERTNPTHLSKKDETTMANKNNKPSKTLGADLPVQTAQTVATTETVQTTETKKSAKRAAIIRVTHPDLKPDSAGTPTVKLSAYPASWSSIYHKALTKDNFESEVVYLNAQADFYDKKARDLRQEAIDVASGNRDTTKSVKKVRTLIESLPSALSDLTAKGINVADLLSALQAQLAKQTAPSTETV